MEGFEHISYLTRKELNVNIHEIKQPSMFNEISFRTEFYCFIVFMLIYKEAGKTPPFVNYGQSKNCEKKLNSIVQAGLLERFRLHAG